MLRRIHADSAERRPTAPYLLATGLAIAAWLVPDRAEACGAVPTPSYTISGMTPSPDASGVARDMGIIVRGLPSSQPGGPTVFADVELIDVDSGEPVPLSVINWWPLGGAEDSMALHPLEPLARLHRYRVEADPLDTEVGGAEGTVFVSSFTTSDTLLEPLVLSGELGLSLRGADVDVTQCGPCGNDCTVTGQRRALITDVQLPVPRGGQGVYRGALHFTDHTPARLSARNVGDYDTSDDEDHDVQVMQPVKLEAGEAMTVQQEVFEELTAYAGCFAFIVWDPAGHVAQTSACLPSLSPDDIRALAGEEGQLPLDVDEDVAVEQVQQAAANSGDRHDNPPFVSCALERNRRTPTPAWPTLLLCSVVVTALLVRRISSSAC